jgi:hypothetical protein
MRIRSDIGSAEPPPVRALSAAASRSCSVVVTIAALWPLKLK